MDVIEFILENIQYYHRIEMDGSEKEEVQFNIDIILDLKDKIKKGVID